MSPNAQRQNGRKYSPGRTKVDPGDPGHDADASAASGSVEDVQKKPKKLQNTLEQVRERSKERTQQNSPSSPGEEPDKPGGETAIPDGLQNDPERPRSVSNKRVDETNAPCQRNGPGGHLGEPEASRGVKGIWDRETVVDGAEHNGICPSSRRNKRVVETNVSCRDKGPRGHMGELEKSRSVGGDWDRQTDVEDIGYDQERREMDGTTSGTRRDSKRVETDPLAEDKAHQHEWRKRMRSDIPRPSTPPPEYPRLLTDYVDPPH